MTTPTNNQEQNLRISSRRSAQALRQIQSHLPAIVIAVESTASHNLIQTFPDAILTLGAYRRNFPTIRATVLTDIVVRDNLERPFRYSVKYLLHSPQYHNRYILDFVTTNYQATPSRTTPFKNNKSLFASAGWLEREA